MRNAANRLDFERGRRFRGPSPGARPSERRPKNTAPGGPERGSARRPRRILAPCAAKDGGGARPEPGRLRDPPPRAGREPRQPSREGKAFAPRTGGGNGGPLNLYHRPRIGRGHPANLSILLTGGKETNRDVLSSGERSGRCPNRTAVLEGAAECGGMGSRGGGKGTNPSGRAEARRAIPRTCSARLRRANASESRAA